MEFLPLLSIYSNRQQPFLTFAALAFLNAGKLLLMALPIYVAFVLGRAPASWARNEPLRILRRDVLASALAAIALYFLGPFLLRPFARLVLWAQEDSPFTIIQDVREVYDPIAGYNFRCCFLVAIGFVLGWIYFYFVSRKGDRFLPPNLNGVSVPNQRVEWDRNNRLFVAISKLLFMMSLPVYVFDSQPFREWPTTGYVALAFGLFAVPGSLAWLANPMLLLTWRFMRRRGSWAALFCAIGATLLALSFLVWQKVPHPSGAHAEVTGYRIGFWLWVTAMITALIGSWIGIRRRKSAQPVSAAKEQPAS